MIQRIQTIYLILSILCSVVLTWVPLSTFDASGIAATLYATAVDAGDAVVTLFPPAWSLVAILLLGIVLRVSAIFDFKNRKRQVHLCRSALFADVLFCIAYALIARSISSQASLTLSFWLALILASIVFTWLAIRGIRHDERLVRAADRLR